MAGGAVGSSRGAGPASRLARFPGPPCVAVAAVAKGLLLRELVRGHVASAMRRAGPTSATGDTAMTPRPRGPGKGAGGSRAWGWSGCRPWRQPGSRRLRVLGVVIDPLDGASPSATGSTGQYPGRRGRRRCGSAGGSRSQLAWLAPRHRAAVRFIPCGTGETEKQPNQRGRGREVDVMSRQQRKQRRNAARRPWRRPLVGLGVLAGWLAVSKRGRQAVKVAKEQAGKARQRLAAARPARTTTVAPPAGAPPGPVLAEVTKLPQDNDSGDEKAGPKPGTGTETATAEPPTNR